MKMCPRCNTAKPLDEFSHMTKAKDGRQIYCKQCFKDRYHLTAQHHRSMVRRRKREVRLDVQQRLTSYLETHACVDCGETDLMVLEFDHVRGVKEANVCMLMQRSHRWPRIEAEIAKCDVVCANCHKRRTYTRCNSWRMGV